MNSVPVSNKSLRGLPDGAQVVGIQRAKPKAFVPGYKSPPVEIGWPVTYYPDSDKSLGPGHRAQICKVEGEVVTIFVFSLEGLRRFNSVRHIDDPKAHSDNLKRHGAWEYADTREWRAIDLLRRDNAILTARIEMLESKIAGILGESEEDIAAQLAEATAASEPEADADATEPQADGQLIPGGGIEETDENDASS